MLKSSPQLLRPTFKQIGVMSALSLALALIPLANANAGGRHQVRDNGGLSVFNLFAEAPGSKYRRPKVLGYTKKVGGYSYQYGDTLDGYDLTPYQFNPIDNPNPFSTRLGGDGVYLGD